MVTFVRNNSTTISRVESRLTSLLQHGSKGAALIVPMVNVNSIERVAGMLSTLSYFAAYPFCEKGTMAALGCLYLYGNRELPVFAYQVADNASPGDTRIVLVVLPHTPMLSPIEKDEALDEIFGLLPERAAKFSDNCFGPVYCEAKGIMDGWQLIAQRRFPQLIGWLRPGSFGYVVIKTADGIKIPY